MFMYEMLVGPDVKQTAWETVQRSFQWQCREL